jgi:hypothetical protein
VNKADERERHRVVGEQLQCVLVAERDGGSGHNALEDQRHLTVCRRMQRREELLERRVHSRGGDGDPAARHRNERREAVR